MNINFFNIHEIELIKNLTLYVLIAIFIKLLKGRRMAIKCLECDTDNPSDSKYCKESATPIIIYNYIIKS